MQQKKKIKRAFSDIFYETNAVQITSRSPEIKSFPFSLAYDPYFKTLLNTS